MGAEVLDARSEINTSIKVAMANSSRLVKTCNSRVLDKAMNTSINPGTSLKIPIVSSNLIRVVVEETRMVAVASSHEAGRSQTVLGIMITAAVKTANLDRISSTIKEVVVDALTAVIIAAVGTNSKTLAIVEVVEAKEAEIATTLANSKATRHPLMIVRTKSNSKRT